MCDTGGEIMHVGTKRPLSAASRKDGGNEPKRLRSEKEKPASLFSATHPSPPIASPEGDDWVGDGGMDYTVHAEDDGFRPTASLIEWESRGDWGYEVEFPPPPSAPLPLTQAEITGIIATHTATVNEVFTRLFNAPVSEEAMSKIIFDVQADGAVHTEIILIPPAESRTAFSYSLRGYQDDNLVKLLIVPPKQKYQGDGASKAVKVALFEITLNPTSRECTCTRYASLSKKSGIYGTLDSLIAKHTYLSGIQSREIDSTAALARQKKISGLEARIQKEREHLKTVLSQDDFTEFTKPSSQSGGEVKIRYRALYLGENVATKLADGHRFTPAQIYKYIESTTVKAINLYRQYVAEVPSRDVKQLYRYLLWDRKTDNLLLTPEGDIIDHDYKATSTSTPTTYDYMEDLPDYDTDDENEITLLRTVYSSSLITMLLLLFSTKSGAVSVMQLMDELWEHISQHLPATRERTKFEDMITSLFNSSDGTIENMTPNYNELKDILEKLSK